jgi:hypothetical protein
VAWALYRRTPGRPYPVRRMARNSVGEVGVGDPESLESSTPVRWGLRVSLVVEWAVAAVLSVVLAAYMLLGIFSRHVADDYAAALAVRERGFWAEQIAYYRQWSGRFTSEAAVTATASLNEAFTRALPALLIACWVAVLLLALKQILPRVHGVARLLLALEIVYATVHLTPSPFLSIYWMTGSLNYVLPLVLATGLLAIVVKRKATSRGSGVAIALGAGIVAFIAGGTSETYVVGQTVALGLAVIIAATPISIEFRSRLRVLCAGLAGSVAALGVLAAAPGNAIRSAEILPPGGRPSLFELARLTIHYTRAFFDALIPTHWPALLAVAVLAALLGAQSTARPSVRSAVILAGAVTAGALITIACAIAPAVYEERNLTPVYGQIMLLYVVVCAIATVAWIAGQTSRTLVDRIAASADRSGRVRGVAIAAMALLAGAGLVNGPISTIVGIAQQVPAIRAYADAKDAQAAAAEAGRADGIASVVVPALPDVTRLGLFSHGPLGDLTSDPTFWINHDEAVYYGVRAMASAPAHG